jgi:SAM-dependent methyltransferase
LLEDKVIIGCDLDISSIKVAARDNTLDNLSVADARALPYSKCVFNSVLANCALEHIPAVEMVITEVARVLKPMGIFAFTVPSEHFNDFLLFPRFYKLLGLPSRARRNIYWYNVLQKHFNIDPLSVWQQRLKISGFSVILHRYYMSKSATLLFSLWDVMAKWTINLPKRGERIYVQQFLLDRIPRRLLFWVLYYHLIGCYRSSLHSNSGSGILIIARKENNLQ